MRVAAVDLKLQRSSIRFFVRINRYTRGSYSVLIYAGLYNTILSRRQPNVENVRSPRITFLLHKISREDTRIVQHIEHELQPHITGHIHIHLWFHSTKLFFQQNLCSVIFRLKCTHTPCAALLLLLLLLFYYYYYSEFIRTQSTR